MQLAWLTTLSTAHTVDGIHTHVRAAYCLAHDVVGLGHTVDAIRTSAVQLALAYGSVDVLMQSMGFMPTAVQLAWLMALSNGIHAYCCAACLAHGAVDVLSMCPHSQ